MEAEEREFHNEDFLSEAQEFYNSVRDMAFVPMDERDVENLKNIIKSTTMRQALNMLLRISNQVMVETSSLNILSDQEHLEVALRAQGKVAGIVGTIEMLIEMAGFNTEPPPLPTVK